MGERDGAASTWPRMLVPAAVTWIGAAICCGMPGAAWGTALVAFVTATLCLVCAVSIQRRGADAATRAAGQGEIWATMLLLGACCAATLGLVTASVAAHAPDRQPAALRALGSSRVTAEVVVTADAVPSGTASSGSSIRFAADLVSVSHGRVLQESSVPVLVFAPAEADRSPRVGERWRITGALRWNAPGDARAALVFVRDPPTRLEETPAALGWSTSLRSGLIELAGSLPGPGGELLPGLAIGDVSQVGDEVTGWMQQSSLSHLTAVSGANCAVIVWLISSAVAALGGGRALRISCALLALTAFVVLVTPQPSVQRAALMAAFVLLMGGFGRPLRGLAALALAVIVLLVNDPWLAGQYGFGLSVLATGGLLLLSGPLTDLLARWLPRRIAALIAIPAAAQLACQPMLVLLDPSIQLGGVPANLLAGPAAAPSTLLGLLACLLAPVSTPLAMSVAWLGWVPASWIAAVARWFAGIPAARVPWPEGPLGVVLVTIPTLLIAILLLRGRELSAGWRRAIAVVVVLSLVVLCGRTVGVGLGTALHRPGDWTIAACDVGQGDAVLLRQGGSTALVDVGPDPEPLRSCLDGLGVTRIDLLVLTHYDLDHVGGLEAVVGLVDHALVGPVDDPADERIGRVLRDAGAEVRQAASGDQGLLGDPQTGAPWQVLWPDPAAGGIEPGNDASVVVRFDLAAASVLLLGDLGAEAQDRLLGRHTLGQAIDVVKVSHHGSADQSERLARSLAASVALVSVGADNGYGHPTRSALDLYAGTGAEILRTDESGTILLAPGEAGAFRVWSERAGAADPTGVGGRR
ncbi:ComEC/Rec2 family competence protein [Plantibacter sp. Leaf314]|uniref:ComEC/Rec2 family competence protein n=1 Tax=Plantibacter sp. Leaf314 TaxID=1736333 RepID=UPI0012FA7F05|nr:ComEC/Rec2 family competence protein [Plantibacter sp. Leaf314]